MINLKRPFEKATSFLFYKNFYFAQKLLSGSLKFIPAGNEILLKNIVLNFCLLSVKL